MKRRLLLRRDVPGDLHSIVRWLDLHSTSAGDRFVDSVFKAFDDLARMPGLGSPKSFRSRRLAGIRSWSVPRFRRFLILYRIHAEAIEVVAVIHGSRNLRKILFDRT
jgi:plasmid stabilization system protein ParE